MLRVGVPGHHPCKNCYHYCHCSYYYHYYYSTTTNDPLTKSRNCSNRSTQQERSYYTKPTAIALAIGIAKTKTTLPTTTRSISISNNIVLSTNRTDQHKGQQQKYISTLHNRNNNCKNNYYYRSSDHHPYSEPRKSCHPVSSLSWYNNNNNKYSSCIRRTASSSSSSTTLARSPETRAAVVVERFGKSRATRTSSTSRIVSYYCMLWTKTSMGSTTTMMYNNNNNHHHHHRYRRGTSSSSFLVATATAALVLSYGDGYNNRNNSNNNSNNDKYTNFVTSSTINNYFNHRKWNRNNPIVIMVMSSLFWLGTKTSTTLPVVYCAENNGAPWISRLFRRNNNSTTSSISNNKEKNNNGGDHSATTSSGESTPTDPDFDDDDDDNDDNDTSTTSTTTANTSTNADDTLSSSCPYYGCLMTPYDVNYGTNVQINNALKFMRTQKRIIVSNTDSATLLKQYNIGTSDAVTLTLIGYKGGPMKQQINQDRSIIVSPYTIYDSTTSGTTSNTSTNNNNNNNNATNATHTTNTTKSTNTTNSTINRYHQQQQQQQQQQNQQDRYYDDQEQYKKKLTQFIHDTNRILLGVFDGHAPLGEHVSEYTATSIPTLLATKLMERATQNTTFRDDPSTKNRNSSKSLTSTIDEENEVIINLTKSVIEEVFVELDQTAPAEVSGGCTATIVLLQGNYIYIANAGDSLSFIVTYRPSTNVSSVVAISREDKPILPEERERVERMGGSVYAPIVGTSRVVYYDLKTQTPTGLAMSRSIGDWEAGKLGVIPNPIIQVLNINDIVQQQLEKDRSTSSSSSSRNVTKNTTSTTTLSTSSKMASAQVDAKGDIEVTATPNTPTDDPNDTSIEEDNDDDDDVYIFAVCATDGMMDFVDANEIGRVLGHSLYAPNGAHPISVVEHLIFEAANQWHTAKNGQYRDDISLAVSTLRKPPKKIQ